MPRKLIMPDQVAKRLIEEVRKRECLWNTEDDHYNDRYHMARAWSEISEELKLPEERLRMKWKNFRDLFKKEIRKFGPVEDYCGKWRYFDALKFINKPERDRRTSEQNDVASDDNNCETKKEIDSEDYETVNGDNEIEVFYDEAYEDPLPDKKRKLSIDEDYDVMFLKSLAPYFKQLDPIRKLVVRSKMQDMLLNEIAAQTSASHFQAKKLC